VEQIRRRWPYVCILLRADSGFAREDLMAWCESNRVDDVFGLARNSRLVAKIATELAAAEAAAEKSARPARRFKDFTWRTRKSWSRRRRVIGKAEWTQGEPNPRFIVTSLKRSEAGARYLYQDVYCARGEMENRIKECQLDLYADRTSAATMRANQLRLWFASMAYNDFRRCDLRDYSAQVAEDRSTGTHLGASDQVRHSLCLSRGRGLGLRCQTARGCRKGARFTRLTRAAAARIRGITRWPTETLKKEILLNAIRRHGRMRSLARQHLRPLVRCFMHYWCEKCGLSSRSS
jgi:hypothetical protein